MLFNIVAGRGASEMEKTIIFICFCRGGVDTKNDCEQNEEEGREACRHFGLHIQVFFYSWLVWYSSQTQTRFMMLFAWHTNLIELLVKKIYELYALYNKLQARNYLVLLHAKRRGMQEVGYRSLMLFLVNQY